jgi:hypothetical protein
MTECLSFLRKQEPIRIILPSFLRKQEPIRISVHASFRMDSRLRGNDG